MRDKYIESAYGCQEGFNGFFRIAKCVFSQKKKFVYVKLLLVKNYTLL